VGQVRERVPPEAPEPAEVNVQPQPVVEADEEVLAVGVRLRDDASVDEVRVREAAVGVGDRDAGADQLGPLVGDPTYGVTLWHGAPLG